MGVLGLAGLAHGAASVIGEATLVIGSATITGADGARRSVARGVEIRVGDSLETQAGAHVHLKFVDGGHVSVRPASRLTIENYVHSSDQPQQSAIKFRLDDGVVRSITGRWGEAERDRFRLNTPVAAIGVKGTDFVVRSDAGTTAASVFTGAIMLTPLTEQCAASLGPCINGSEKFLSESMKGQMLELNRHDSTPQLVPAVDLLASAKSQSRAAASGGANLAPEPARKETAQSHDGTQEKAVLAESRADSAVAAGQLELIRQQGITPPAPQLSWGRYAWSQQLPADEFAQQLSLAMLYSREKLTSNGDYVLLREAPAGLAFAPADAVASFRLTASASSVVRDAGHVIEPVKLTDSSLNVDFSRATFNTRLIAQGPVMGAELIQASGAIQKDGSLRVDAANSFVQGGFSTDGKEAGYLFQKNVNAGSLSGITLWGR